MQYLIEWNAEDKIRDPIPWKYKQLCKCKNFTNYVLLDKYNTSYDDSQSFCKTCLPNEYLELLDIKSSEQIKENELHEINKEKDKLKQY